MAGATATFFSLPFAARAQSSAKLTPQLLERLVTSILKGTETIRIGDGGIVGLSDQGVETKQAAFRDNGTRYTLAVVVPRRADGLIFIAHPLKLAEARIHRTDLHLRRVASSRIIRAIGSDWSGRDCDADFAGQLAAWAKRGVP